jgi:hypothetical protein
MPAGSCRCSERLHNGLHSLHLSRNGPASHISLPQQWNTLDSQLSHFFKKSAYGTPSLALACAPPAAAGLGAGPLARGKLPGGFWPPHSPAVLSSVALPHAATTFASKGLGAANRLIVACDALKLRATSACASPSASLKNNLFEFFRKGASTSPRHRATAPQRGVGGRSRRHKAER